MANSGDYFDVTLRETHISWGDYRHTTSRDRIHGEAYIPIPRNFAVELGLFNSNHRVQGLGYNLFIATTSDGFLENVPLLAQGCSSAGDIYAKQFSVQGDLKQLGNWYRFRGVTPGNTIRVRWLNQNDIILDIL